MFKFLSLLSMTEIRTKDQVIYLTFDDGPEAGITEAVLNLLKEHDAKATFFCTGENFEKHPDLIKLIRENGHALGNHSYSHLNGLKEKFRTYIDDVARSKEIIQTNLFRPPWGALTLRKIVTIRLDNKIILWSISSDDMKSDTNWDIYSKKMIKKNETRQYYFVPFFEKPFKKHITNFTNLFRKIKRTKIQIRYN